MAGLQHKDDYFETPEWIIKTIEITEGIKFKIDGCANYNNKICPIYIPDDKYGGALNNEIPENQWDFYDGPVFINPPRSKNGKFVKKAFDVWDKSDKDITMLLCWNDLGNKYADRLRGLLLGGQFHYGNLGKIKFCKNGIESKYPSRLSYFWVRFIDA